jgi:hypothetical protein
LLDGGEHEDSQRNPVEKFGRRRMISGEPPSKRNDDDTDEQNLHRLHPRKSVVRNRRRRVCSERKHGETLEQGGDTEKSYSDGCPSVGVRNKMIVARQTIPQDTKGP